MTNSPTLAVGREIRAQMARKDLNQADIAEVLGVTQTSVSNRLRGLVPWDINELAQVADYLGVPLADLLPSGDAGEVAS